MRLVGGSRLSAETPSSTSVLQQRLQMAVQRGNAAGVLGTFGSGTHGKSPICLVYELCSDSVFELPNDWICVEVWSRCTVRNYPVFDLSSDQ